jgi:hypothetical protein
LSKSLLVVMALSGCVHNQAELARYIDTTLLATSTASIACDWGYTHKAAAAGWHGTREANPMLGPTPSTSEVNVYFVGMMALNAAVWALTPAKIRGALPLAITVRQSSSIAGNSESVGGFCGL